ncbi:AAA family ATPase [Aeromonas sp. 25-281]
MALDLLAAFEQEPPALDFIWSGFLAGTVGALIAPGATGKSFWALQAAMAVACKESDGDLLQLRPTRSGPQRSPHF